MATIQASFANAAEFFNSLLGVEHQYAWRLARTRPATPAGAAALIQYVLDDDPVTEEEILAHDRAQDRGCGTQQHGRGGGLMSSPLDTFGVQEVFCEALLLTLVRGADGEGHAVLTVTTDKGDYVLDNQNENVVPWTETEYRFVKRQSQSDPNMWVSLGDSRAAVATASAREH